MQINIGAGRWRIQIYVQDSNILRIVTCTRIYDVELNTALVESTYAVSTGREHTTASPAHSMALSITLPRAVENRGEFGNRFQLSQSFNSFGFVN